MFTTQTHPAPTTETSPLAQLEIVFQLLAQGPSPVSVDGAQLHGLPDRMIDIVELRTTLLQPGTSPELRDRVWRHLTALAHDNKGQWLVVAAGMAAPGLRHAAARLCLISGIEPTDVDAEVLTGFLEAVTQNPPSERHTRICARLCASAYAAGRRAIRSGTHHHIAVGGGFASHPPARPCGHPDLVLADAVAQGVVTQSEAALISATRLEGETLAHRASLTGHSQSALRLHRRHAEQRLRVWLTGTAAAPRSHNRGHGFTSQAPARTVTARAGHLGVTDDAL